MNKIWDFINKWAFVAFLGILCVALLFALGCGIYTSIINPTVGIIGSLGIAVCLAFLLSWMIVEVNDNNDIEEYEDD
jgi:hypothetical protein